MPFSNALLAFLADRSAFCYATQDILAVEGGITAAIILPMDPRNRPDEVCLPDFRRTVAADTAREIRPGVGDGTRQEYNVFSGILSVKYGMLRSENKPSDIPGCMTLLDEREAAVRACFLRSSHFFTVGRLANFVVNDIIESQSPVYGVDKSDDRERDYFELYFLISYERIMTNFPAG